ncbi:MAG: hypothetical protein RLZZ88_1130, partial [Actinomycetota bacterium]
PRDSGVAKRAELMMQQAAAVKLDQCLVAAESAAGSPDQHRTEGAFNHDHAGRIESETAGSAPPQPLHR